MIEASPFALLRPLWLLAIPAVLVLASLVGLRAAALGGWVGAVRPAMMEALRRRGLVVAGAGRSNLAVTLAALLIAAALTGPAIERPGETGLRNLDGTVIAVDLSRSVAASPQFEAARAATRDALASAGTRQTALVVFAGDAFLASPFTSDHAALAQMVFTLDASTVPVPGSRPGAALALAADLFAKAGVPAGDVVLVSDGDGIDAPALDLGRAIGTAGILVHTLHVEPAEGRPGSPGALRALAGAAGGSTAEATEPGAVLAALAGRPASRLGRGDLQAFAWRDLGPFLLVLALAPALLLFRRSI